MMHIQIVSEEWILLSVTAAHSCRDGGCLGAVTAVDSAKGLCKKASQRVSVWSAHSPVICDQGVCWLPLEMERWQMTTGCLLLVPHRYAPSWKPLSTLAVSWPSILVGYGLSSASFYSLFQDRASASREEP